MGKLFGDICDRVELKNGVTVWGGYKGKRDFKTTDVTACLNGDKNDLEGETTKVRKAMWLQEQSLWGERGTESFPCLRDG